MSQEIEPTNQIVDLEIKDAQLIFDAVWEDLEEEYPKEKLRFPKELILLGGAPGAGKGTQTNFILKARGLTSSPIVVSSLLNSPEAQRIKDQGGMVGDKEVVSILLRKLLQPEFRDGALLDGFPRTRVQVECLKRLVDRINQLHKEFSNTPHAIHFRTPIIHAMVLFINERTSIERQLRRGEEIEQHNRDVAVTGIGEQISLRSTDTSIETAAHRYRVFKEQTWDALQSLKETYHYHFINAEGPIAEVEQNILEELKYQSSLELEAGTYDRVRGLPLAKEITMGARQDLVRRLDSYALENTRLFEQVINMIDNKFIEIVRRHALSGKASVNSEDPLFEEPATIPILIDIFSERGYHAVVDKTITEIPDRINLETGEISTRKKKIYRVQIYFEGSEIRRG